MKTTKKKLAIAASLLALGATVPAANAATIVWQGGTGSLSSANWTVDSVPNQNHPGNASGVHSTTISGGTVTSFTNATVGNFNVISGTADTLLISGGAAINVDFIRIEGTGTAIGSTITLESGTITVSDSNGFRSAAPAFNGSVNFTGAVGSASITQANNGTVSTALAAKLSATALSYFAIDGTMVSTGIAYNGANLAAINAALATGGNVVGGRHFLITDASGTQTLTLVPEPTTALLGVIGMLSLLRRRR